MYFFTVCWVFSLALIFTTSTIPFKLYELQRIRTYWYVPHFIPLYQEILHNTLFWLVYSKTRIFRVNFVPNRQKPLSQLIIYELELFVLRHSMIPRVWVFFWMTKIQCKLMKNKEKQAVKVDSRHPAMSRGSRLFHPWTESSKWRLLKVRLLGYYEEDSVLLETVHRKKTAVLFVMYIMQCSRSIHKL